MSGAAAAAAPLLAKDGAGSVEMKTCGPSGECEKHSRGIHSRVASGGQFTSSTRRELMLSLMENIVLYLAKYKASSASEYEEDG